MQYALIFYGLQIEAAVAVGVGAGVAIVPDWFGSVWRVDLEMQIIIISICVTDLADWLTGRVDGCSSLRASGGAMPMPAFAPHDRHDHQYIMRMDQNREAAKFLVFFACASSTGVAAELLFFLFSLLLLLLLFSLNHL